MSTYTETRLLQVQPGTTAATILTGAATFTDDLGQTYNNVKRIIIKTIRISNTAASNATLGINLIKSGGTLGNANSIVPNVSYPANSATSDDPSQVLGIGDTLNAIQGTAGAITLTISGVIVQ